MSAGSRVRRINEPVPAQVWLGADERPARVQWQAGAATGRPRGGRAAGEREELVECVLDTWFVDDAWWSDSPVRRIYHEVQLASGTRLVVSWDLLEQRWQAQR